MYRTDKQFMKNPATASSRIYIGAIADGVVAADLEEKFTTHGKVVGLVLQRGFGFIQFETEAQAQVAIRAEHNQVFHGRKLNVRQAMDKGRGGPQGNAPQAQENVPERKALTPSFEKPSGPPSLKPGGPPSLLEQTIQLPKQRQAFDNQDEMMDTDVLDETSEDKHDLENDPFANSDGDDDTDNRNIKQNRRGGGGGGRQSQIRGGRQRRNDFMARDMPVHRSEPAFRKGDGPLRDRQDVLHRPDIIHRDHVEPSLLRDRGDALHRDRGDGPQFFGREEHFRDRPAPVFIPPPALERPERNDCEIIVVSKALTEYAEFIEQRLKALGLVVDLLFPNEDVPIGRVLANISSRGCLYAIMVMPQNEEFRSLTLNILHGIPQEHRNMPIEDALIFMNRNFDAYMRGEKPGATTLGSVTSMLSERHPEQIQLLCNLLSENRQITTSQYDRLLKYLQDRRELQSQYEVAESGAELNAEGEPNIKQVELQNRIMNILNKSADEPPKPAEAPPAQAAGPTPLLNDPSVQKALDSLLSGDMFKSISTSGF